MTGTSMDGLDIAVVDIGAGTPVIHAATTTPLPSDLVQELATLVDPAGNEIDRLGAADAALGEFIGHAIRECLKRWGLAPDAVRGIGSHGQTVRHRPTSTRPFTLQLGDPNRIAEITGIDTVADFRRRDMAAGGQGAPLAPLFHDALFGDRTRDRMVLNIGGIANLTVLRTASHEIVGFDTGPGNALLDAWHLHCRHIHGKEAPYDQDGAWAASGQALPALLATLERDAFVHTAPPKSTGKETYNLGYVQRAIAASLQTAAAPEDVQATLSEFTARSVAVAVGSWGCETGDLVVCGGGRRNRDLMARLAERLGRHHVLASDELGVDGDALEAAAFAWFAYRTLTGKPSNAPSVTGARGERILGAIHRA